MEGVFLVAQHDWHLIDAERKVECRQLSDDHFQLKWDDGTTTDMTALEFDQWRKGGEGGD